MALRKRRNMGPSRPPPMAEREREREHSSVVDGDAGAGTGAGASSMKFVLLACAVVMVLLVFAISWKREAVGSCRLCLRGDGLVREFRDGDGGRVEVGFADEGDGEVIGRVMSHPQICPRLYHEKQISRLDLMHALNNLMQGNDRFAREEMDDLAERVQEGSGSSFKKHFDPFRGNYDAEVLKAAAASRAKKVVFIDTVQGLESVNLSGRDDRLVGLIVHLRKRLWIAIRQYKGLWYNFDSTKATPLVFCDGASGLHMFLDKVVEEGGMVVLVLKPPPVAPVMLAQRPPPSFRNLEYWKNLLHW